MNTFSVRNLFGAANGKASVAGGVGALVGFIVSSLILAPFFDFSLQSRAGFAEMLLGQALLSLVSGTVLSACILAYDNQAGLRGRWDRDLWRGLAVFAVVSFISGGLGQLLYSFVGQSRAIPWILMGGGIGAGIGLLRRDAVQAQRGALGGAIGGMLGGFLVDGFLAFSYTDESFARASMIGIIVTGAAIALFMRVVQDALKNAWLLGVSTGPYEGKEYPLNTARVSVGRSEASDIALFRENAMPEQLGAFLWQGENWHWNGTPVSINGAFQSQCALAPGDTIQLGGTQFRFQTRSFKTPPQPANSFPPASYSPPNPCAPLHPPQQPPQIPAHYPPQNVPPAPTVNMAACSWIFQGATTVPLPMAPARVHIGRAQSNEIVVGEASVSSRHARLEISFDTLTITDLGSTNGTFVNGVRAVPEVPIALRPGDRVKLGRNEYQVQQI